METEQSKIGLAVIITALLVGGAVYYTSAGENKTPTVAGGNKVALADSSKEYAVMGRELWSAFECASWASVMGDNIEQERLFTAGYERGKTFLAAVDAGKITEEDSSNEIPIAVLLLLQGPTPEFILGRLFETAQTDALEEVFGTDGQYNDEEMRKIIASNKFTAANCRLIGK